MTANSPLKAFSLGISSMDEPHAEFTGLVNRLNDCNAIEFAELFPALLEHIETHFAEENALMEQSGFPAAAQHKAEHNRVLSELSGFADQMHGKGIPRAQEYVRDQLTRWFKLHLITMDNALVAHLSDRKPQASGL